MRPANLSRRLVAALSSVFLLQLTLLGSGTLCGMRDARVMGGSVMTESMNGMQHAVVSTSPHANRQTPMVSSAPTSACDTRGETSMCGNPWAAGSCISMAACSVAAVAPVSNSLNIVASVRVRHIAALLAAPIGPSFAPELPPPRA